MDPLTVFSGAAAAVGLGLAWRMYRRASRAEAEVAELRGVLHSGRAGAAQVTVPNQRPWRMAPQSSRGRTHPP